MLAVYKLSYLPLSLLRFLLTVRKGTIMAGREDG